MLRGLPFSIMVHLTALALLATWGGQVRQPPLKPQRVMRVQIARPPVEQPPVSEPIAEPEPAPQQPQPDPPSRPLPERPPVVLPPKDVPREEPRREPPQPLPEPRPAPQPQQQEPAPAPPSETQQPEPSAPAGGPTISGTDVDFPFAWYLSRVEGIIARQWNPRQLGFREGTSRTCVVHFMIDRNGQVSQVTLVRSSRVSLFDREALRAVKTGRLPPLPPRFPHRALGVTFIFTLESGI